MSSVLLVIAGILCLASAVAGVMAGVFAYTQIKQRNLANQSANDAVAKARAILFQEYQQELIYRFKNKKHYKRIFLWCAMSLLCLVLFGSAAAIWYFATRESEQTAAIITAVGGLVSTLLGLPLIITNYLFNKDEDRQIAQQLLKIGHSPEQTLSVEKFANQEAVKETLVINN